MKGQGLRDELRKGLHDFWVSTAYTGVTGELREEAFQSSRDDTWLEMDEAPTPEGTKENGWEVLRELTNSTTFQRFYFPNMVSNDDFQYLN